MGSAGAGRGDQHPMNGQRKLDKARQKAQKANERLAKYEATASAGAPRGMILGGTMLQPETLAGIVDSTCGDRPTVIIISACFSGVFLPALEGDNRMILTAARPDRTSFGCTQDARYPYFDACVVKDLPGAHDFPDLADRVKGCVANREQETGMSPPSEPQVFIGSKVADNLPTW